MSTEVGKRTWVSVTTYLLTGLQTNIRYLRYLPMTLDHDLQQAGAYLQSAKLVSTLGVHDPVQSRMAVLGNDVASTTYALGCRQTSHRQGIAVSEGGIEENDLIRKVWTL